MAPSREPAGACAASPTAAWWAPWAGRPVRPALALAVRSFADSVAAFPGKARLWRRQRAAFSKSYREDAASLAEDLAANPPDSADAYSPNLRYESQSSVSVICQ